MRRVAFNGENDDFDFNGYDQTYIDVYFNNGVIIYAEQVDKMELAEANGYDIGNNGFWADDNYISEGDTINGVPVDYWMPSSDEVLFHIEGELSKENIIDNTLKTLFKGFGMQYKKAV